MTKTRIKRFNIYTFLIIFLLISIVLGFIFLIPNVQETALPDDLKLSRERFPNIETVALDFMDGTALIPNTVSLDEIYKIEVVLSGCDYTGDIIFDGIKRAEYSLQKCSNLFFEENGEAFQHFDQKSIFIEVDGLSTKELSYQISNKLETFGIIDLIAINIWEMVDCTRSSQCSQVVVDNKKIQSFCSVNHLCTINSDDPRVEESKQNLDEREEKSFKINIPGWIYPAFGLLLGVIIIFFMIRGRKES